LTGVLLRLAFAYGFVVAVVERAADAWPAILTAGVPGGALLVLAGCSRSVAPEPRFEKNPC
jgi:hypothetical protein